jgi:hypothetical protein
MQRFDASTMTLTDPPLLPRACYHAPATADLDIDGKNAFQWCVTRRWAQVIAA